MEQVYLTTVGTKSRQACGSAHRLSPLLQVVRAIVPKIILDDVFTVRPQLVHSCMVNGFAGLLP